MNKEQLLQSLDELILKIGDLEQESKIELLNEFKLKLHQASPFVNEPVDCVVWVKSDNVVANDYNPNSVAPPEMKLLQKSIENDGYTQPIVTWMADDKHEVVDGFHRSRVGKEVKQIQERIFNYLPVVVVNEDSAARGDRIASTIRHNRARGKHSIDGMAEIVLELKRRNWSDKKIGEDLGMDPDEVLRLSQITGLAEMFADREFSQAWEMDSIDEQDNLDLTNEGPTA